MVSESRQVEQPKALSEKMWLVAFRWLDFYLHMQLESQNHRKI